MPAVQLLLLDAAHEPARTLHHRLCERGFAAAQRELVQAAEDASWTPPDVAVVVVGDVVDVALAEQTARVIKRLVTENVATLVWGAADKIAGAGGPLVEWLEPDTTLDEIIGRLGTLAHYVPLVRRFERELNHLHRLGEQLNHYLSEIDQEMRLAGRLQRDFLPRKLPELPGLEFSVLYRPASWVSGDLYDAFRVDERHVGLLVADAMGHGVAAGLQTMFLRQVLVTKEITGSSHSIVSPADTLAALHQCLVRQKLPNCQFVTAAYALYDTTQRELCLARGGHPYPLLIRADGEIGLISASGSLLGLADVPFEIEEVRLTLGPGDKVVFYTDGLEDDFFTMSETRCGPGEFTPALREWAALGVGDFVEALREHLDSKEGSLHPVDDVTLLALQIVA